MRTKAISEGEDISTKYLEQIVSLLKKAGLVHSLRGHYGGHVLARSPSEISTKDVVVALEGPMLPDECRDHREYVPHCSDCITRQFWQELQGAVMEVLEKETLAELLERSS